MSKMPSNQNGIRILGGVVCLGCAASVLAGEYEHKFQELYGQRATFNVSGPATGSSPNPQGDAKLTSVEFPSGDEFIFFYKPVAVTDVQYSGTLSQWRVRAGSNTTNGLSGDYIFGTADGNSANQTSEDREAFADLILQAMQSDNLNQYVDLSGSGNEFSFIIEFDRSVMDNDADQDDFGELLYFERGAGSGNSWLKIQAVDENGAALGPWLVIQPSETVQTTPVTTVYNSSQTMGTTSIDVSRLGVSEFKYLKISNDVAGEAAYSGGGDMAPDFKFMSVMTNEAQIAEVMVFD